jgi:hypothetical protein
VALKLACALVHNKNTALANRTQITNLAALVVTNTDPVTGRVSYTLSGVTIEHECIFLQVVPFGVARPSNMGNLNSYNVIYGTGDENKTGDHARFFNWILKRGCDYGADIVLYVRFPNLLAATDINLALARLTTTRVFLERTWGKMASARLLQVLRSLREETLDEGQAFDNAVEDLKARIVARGMEWE